MGLNLPARMLALLRQVFSGQVDMLPSQQGEIFNKSESLSARFPRKAWVVRDGGCGKYDSEPREKVTMIILPMVPACPKF